MIDVSEIINDPDFCQSFTVYRDSGSWIEGRWVSSTSTLSMSGVISVASAKELNQVPEGDRVEGAIVIHTTDQIYATRAASPAGISDKIEWNGELYKIIQMYPYSDYGFYKAIATRITGD